MRPRAELLPLTLNLSVGERVALARADLRLRRGVAAWHRSRQRRAGESEGAWQARAAGFGSDRSLSQLLGPMPAPVESIFRSAARRAAGELDQLSAGAGLSLFGALWVGNGSASQLNISGGSGRLAGAAQDWLGDRLWLDAPAVSVRAEEDHAVVTVERSGAVDQISAHHVIVAVPAPLVRDVVADLPGDVDRSLASMTYGAFVSMRILRREPAVMPWTQLYAITTPGLSFDMLFNDANPVSQHATGPRAGSFMCYAGGSPAQQLLDLPDEQIRARFLADLYRVYPELRGLVETAVVQKWSLGNVHGTPQTRFEAMWRYARRPGSLIHFAGDYFAPLGGSMDAAARSGFEAAYAVSEAMAHHVARETEIR